MRTVSELSGHRRNFIFPLAIIGALSGFSNAIMWSAIWSLAIEGLGKFTKTGAALLIIGIVGAALLPLVYGEVAKMVHSQQTGYVLMIPCYL